MSNHFTKLKGKINRLVGEATGDRGQEAKGVVEESTGREPKDENEFEEAKAAVKESHHDFGERVPPHEAPRDER